MYGVDDDPWYAARLQRHQPNLHDSGCQRIHRFHIVRNLYRRDGTALQQDGSYSSEHECVLHQGHS